MEINLTIGWDDLSKECKEKIKQLQKLVGKKSVFITYPPINQFVEDHTSGVIRNYCFEHSKALCTKDDEFVISANRSILQS